MYCLVTGGAGSGKSEYAESLALSLADSSERLFYIATMYPYDDEETKKRIERHKSLRAGKGFITIERPFEIARALDEIKSIKKETDCPTAGEKKVRDEIQNECYNTVELNCGTDQRKKYEVTSDHENDELKDAVVLLEDLTNLYANECFQTNGHPHEIAAPLREIADNVKALIVVSNELYCDGIQYPEETMGFLRELALINRDIAKDADKVIEVVAGIPAVVK
ncbi:bifunctional adenosylcobinamide kinase/adenosylcobinamide-phosphate guanylyltransferase [Oribacterium sp. WCC10]|uniref:bifunctional adenosylcobinamide kinase/adenosylcobinamide-phosphate guanylyltransferase n=1 Tax=Oribacterium sp. WCC10 TaxID=1855343 RepID=UPI0008F0079C|nr:bifunctional adenosylcobinamide kinase/adenosylcobinamide-phosphate guanylyltransferase [Oribacterium sp. WCC10]SFG74217.1 adenosylcobinamide kinase /adenosylcobinamide-phosphate guanylyltransferase [Oribacterium sp. WCC10]